MQYPWPFIESPNNSNRKGMPVEGIVIHYTAGSGAEDTAKYWFSKSEAKASAHLVIGRDGDVYQCVDFERAAWHAGISEMMIKGEMQRNINQRTIGVELANHGRLFKDGNSRFCYSIGGQVKNYNYPSRPVHARLLYDNGTKSDGWWEPYPELQIETLCQVLNILRDIGYETACDNVVGHEEIAMPLGRKMDPGPLFPWDKLGRTTPGRTQSILLD